MYLNEEQLEAIRLSIQDKREQLIAKARARHDEEIANTEAKGDDIDIATAKGIAATLGRLQSRDLRLLKKLDEALRWMDDEEFGFCTDCEEEIGFTRLVARPAAKLCIECKESQERTERGYYHPRRRRVNARRDDE